MIASGNHTKDYVSAEQADWGIVAVDNIAFALDFFRIRNTVLHNPSDKIGSEEPILPGQIVKQVQHFQPKLQLVFSSQDISWDGY